MSTLADDQPSFVRANPAILSFEHMEKGVLTMGRLIASIALTVFASAAYADDPVQTDGDMYKVKLENNRVRVLEYRDRPGEKTRQHSHPAFALYALAPFKRRITLPDGKVIMREFKAGDVLWSEGQTHIGENVGDTPTHAIMIEVK